jgi:hypothetical protein
MVTYRIVFVQHICESKAKSYKNIWICGNLQYFSTLKVPKCEILDFRHPPHLPIETLWCRIIKIQAI